MNLMKLKSPLWSLLVMALLVGLPFFCSEAQAQRRGGGGSHGGGGVSGGSFRGGGGSAAGPRGGAAVQGPRGGAAVQGPRGGAVAEGPRGGAAARGPEGGTAYRPGTYPAGGGTYNRNVNVSGNWNAYNGPGYRGPGYGAVAAGAVAGLAVGTVVGALPAAVAAQSLAGQTYYASGDTYYQPCYQGTEVAYCVVPNPNQ